MAEIDSFKYDEHNITFSSSSRERFLGLYAPSTGPVRLRAFVVSTTSHSISSFSLVTSLLQHKWTNTVKYVKQKDAYQFEIKFGQYTKLNDLPSLYKMS